jgi:cholera toxin transcriptional activator
VDRVSSATLFPMPEPSTPARYRFGVFEADLATGELRRKGVRLKLHSQPFAILILLLERPSELVTREEIARHLWPGDTFVDFDHGVNSAINRLRDALSDKAANPRFIETLARRGYRFLAPVEAVFANEVTAVEPQAAAAVPVTEDAPFLDRVLATPADLPPTSPALARNLFLSLQLMYLGFYVGALANLPEINDLLSPLHFATQAFVTLIVTAAVLIPVRIFLVSAILFRAPAARANFLKLWRLLLLPMDLLWCLAPFLLLHHIHLGVALACATPLVYSPFAQRSLILMGATEAPQVTSGLA